MDATLTIVGSQEILSLDEIMNLEKTMGFNLPADYKQFLLNHNGGTPQPKRFTTMDGKVKSMVSVFLPLCDDIEDNLLEEMQGITLAGQIPGNLIPIAMDPTDNRVVMSCMGDDINKVYYWAWDEEPQRKHKPSYKYMRLIADSFTEFISKLHD